MFFVASIFGVIGVLLTLAILIIFLLRQRSSLIFDKYPNKSFLHGLKYVIALVVIKRLRHRFYHKSKEILNMESLDKPQSLEGNEDSYDVVSFMGASEKGHKLLITLERRRRGVLKACIYLWLPELGLICSPKLPDMMHFTTDGEAESEEFRGSGFHIYPELSMRRWRVRYDGELKRVKDQKLFAVKLDLTFSSKPLHFNYNKDLSASVIADSVAREAWNSEFYSMLHNVDQIVEKRMHYDQNGILQGQLQLGQSKLLLQMKGLRDHSFGTERCLSGIHRYVYFALFLDDGTNMVVGNLSQPSFFLSSLKIGYICTPTGDYKPITGCNFELYSYGERGIPPKNKNFIVSTVDREYFVHVKAEDTDVRYIGSDWTAKVFNQFVSCTVNGVKGQGLTEYLYRNEGGRPKSVSDNDPQWYQLRRSVSRSEQEIEFI